MQAQLVKPTPTRAAVKVATVSQTQSLALVKNVIRAAISEVCFLRNLFPEDAFVDTHLGTTKIRALAPRELDEEGQPTGAVTHKDAAALTRMLESAFDALEKGYLRGIVLGIYSAEEDPAARQLLESYVFNVTYPSPSDVEVTLKTDKDAFTLPRVRNEALQMVRGLIRLCEGMKPVAEDRAISLRLFYYDDVRCAEEEDDGGGSCQCRVSHLPPPTPPLPLQRTPPGYQPPSFEDATMEHHTFFKDAPLLLPLGKVASVSAGLFRGAANAM